MTGPDTTVPFVPGAKAAELAHAEDGWTLRYRDGSRHGGPDHLADRVADRGGGGRVTGTALCGRGSGGGALAGRGLRHRAAPTRRPHRSPPGTSPPSGPEGRRGLLARCRCGRLAGARPTPSRVRRHGRTGRSLRGGNGRRRLLEGGRSLHEVAADHPPDRCRLTGRATGGVLWTVEDLLRDEASRLDADPPGWSSKVGGRRPRPDATPGSKMPTTAGGLLATSKTTRESESSPSAVPPPFVHDTLTTCTGSPPARLPPRDGAVPEDLYLPAATAMELVLGPPRRRSEGHAVPEHEEAGRPAHGPGDRPGPRGRGRGGGERRRRAQEAQPADGPGE